MPMWNCVLSLRRFNFNLYVYMYAYVGVPAVWEGQIPETGIAGSEWWVLLLWLLETELRSFVIEVCALNHWAETVFIWAGLPDVNFRI